MKIISIITLLLMVSTTWAQNAKVGVVNLEEVLIKSKFYPLLNQRMEDFIETKNTKVVEINTLISSKEKALKLGIITPEGQGKVEAEIKELTAIRDQLIAKGQQEVDDLEIRLRQPIIKAILAAIKKTAKDKKFQLILEKSSPILETNLSIENIDALVIKELNQ